MRNSAAFTSFLLALVLGLYTASATSAELPSFAELVERNAPSIVEISTLRSVEARSPATGSWKNCYGASIPARSLT